MTRHMMQQDMVRSDMGKIQAASCNYAGNSSCYWGYFRCAYYYGGQNGYRLKWHTWFDLLTRVDKRLRRSGGAAFFIGRV